jgi:hypothetical protein
METLAERLEGVRDAARARRSRPQDGPIVVPLREPAGQQAQIVAEAEGFEPSRRL